MNEVFAMSVTDYNARLYEKMKAEQDKYRGWLLHQEPSEILNHTYEYIVGHNDGNVYPNGLISRAETGPVKIYAQNYLQARLSEVNRQ